MDMDQRRVAEALRVLGLSAHSDPEQVTRAYRRLVRVTHPDVSADPDAAQRFAAVSAAYRLLSGTAGSPESPAPSSAPSSVSESSPPPRSSNAGISTGSPGATTPTDPVHSGSLFAVSPPLLRAGYGDRPPIVAGPVFVRRPDRRPHRGAEKGEA